MINEVASLVFLSSVCGHLLNQVATYIGLIRSLRKAPSPPPHAVMALTVSIAPLLSPSTGGAEWAPLTKGLPL